MIFDGCPDSYANKDSLTVWINLPFKEIVMKKLVNNKIGKKSLVFHPKHRLIAGLALAITLIVVCFSLGNAPNDTIVAAAPAGPRTALIHGSTVSGGASSQEAQAATAQGYTVTVVNDATWQSMTSAQFGSYDLLIIGDPTCSSATFQPMTNAAVWAPVVMGTAGGRTLAGNRVLIGTDPVFHSGGVNTARGTIIRTGIDFAGKQPGRTGLYFSTSCSGGGGTILTALNLLSTGSGTWLNAGAPCGGSVSLIAAEPSFATLTSASLQGWSCSVHNTWVTFKSDWSALAVATDTATKPVCGIDPNTGASACGQAYILIAGSSIVVASGSITVSPLDATNPVGTNHTVTANVTSGGAPLVGQIVTFTVTGQNAGATGTCLPAGCITDSNGDVSFTYTGTNGVGDDTIKASFTDATGSLQAATAQKHWIITDRDGDGIPDDDDNCPDTANPDQADSDGDGRGDACDACPLDAANDADGDGVCGNVDNCPIANPDQADSDGDGRGDACDACPLDAANDADGDGICGNLDNCPLTANPDQRDTNGDGVGDLCTPFQYPAGGQFVIGNLVSQTGGATVNFWGSQWSRNNPMSGGSGPNSFKGFENGLSLPACGSTWTSQPGNSSNPPPTIPQNMAVIVSNSVSKSGAVITGNVSRIIVVQTNSGYGPSPGHQGTGQVIAILCDAP